MFLIIICIPTVSFVRPRDAYWAGYLQNIVKLCNMCSTNIYKWMNKRMNEWTATRVTLRLFQSLPLSTWKIRHFDWGFLTRFVTRGTAGAPEKPQEMKLRACREPEDPTPGQCCAMWAAQTSASKAVQGTLKASSYQSRDPETPSFQDSASQSIVEGKG